MLDIGPKSDNLHKGGGGINEHGINMMTRMPEFQYLTRDEVARLTELGPRIYQKDETLLSINDDPQILLILLAGVCRIETRTSIAGDNHTVCVERVHAPAVLGEVSIFSTMPRSASVVTDRKSVAIIVPASSLRELFKNSNATLPLMFWSFAKLGLARIRTSVTQFGKLYDKYIRTDTEDAPDFEKEIFRLEKIIGPEPSKSKVDENTFNSLSALLENVDKALGVISHLDQIKDKIIPSDSLIAPEQKASLSPLAALAASRPGSRGKPIKQAVAEACVENPDTCPRHLGWIPCVEAIILATKELMSFLPLAQGKDNKRGAIPGSEDMIGGFTKRIEKELDRIENDALERFGLESLTNEIEDESARFTLSRFLSRRISNIKARVSLEDFESAGLSEYHRPGPEVRDKTALELFNRVYNHPVIWATLNKTCHKMESCERKNADSDRSLLDFFCRGCRLAYPLEDEGDLADADRTPYPMP